MTKSLTASRFFSLFSWLFLLAALVLLVSNGYETYKRLFAAPGVQQFSFGVSSQSSKQVEVGLTEIIDRHIFGVVPVVREVVKKDLPKVVEAPPTRLNLKLAGVIAAPNPDFSMAMIEIRRGETGVVRIGGEIGKTGAVLNKVFSDHILIEHRGKLEKLEIERQTLAPSAPASGNAQTISELNISEEKFAALGQGFTGTSPITACTPPARPGRPDSGDESDGKCRSGQRATVPDRAAAFLRPTTTGGRTTADPGGIAATGRNRAGGETA